MQIFFLGSFKIPNKFGGLLQLTGIIACILPLKCPYETLREENSGITTAHSTNMTKQVTIAIIRDSKQVVSHIFPGFQEHKSTNYKWLKMSNFWKW